jgi:hypothetical protein
MCERWDFCRGFSVDLLSHKIGSKDYMILQGSKRKTAILSSSHERTDRGLLGVGLNGD